MNLSPGNTSSVSATRPRFGFGAVAIALAAWIGVLVAYTFLVSRATHRATFIEDGPVENLSIAGWWLLATLCAWQAKLAPRVLWPGALVALIGAARENDMKLWISNEYLFKKSWYKLPDVALPEKLWAGFVALAVAALLVYLLVRAARAFLQRPLWSTDWLRTLFLAMAVGAASLFFDKLQAYVHDFTGSYLPPPYAQLIESLEEGLELVLPLLFAAALLQARALVARRP